MRYYIYDRKKEKFIFPERRYFVEYLSLHLGEEVTRDQVLKFLKGLNREVGVFITAIDYDGQIREDSPLDYFTSVMEFLQERGYLVEKGKL